MKALHEIELYADPKAGIIKGKKKCSEKCKYCVLERRGKQFENALLGKEENDSQKGTVMTKMCNENAKEK